MIYFRLIGCWGPTRTSLVAYVIPVWGIILGAVFLGEVIDAGRLLGSALVIGGIALVNLNREMLGAFATRIRGIPAKPPEATAEPITEPR